MKKFSDVVDVLVNIGNYLIYLFMALGMLYFLWGLFGFMRNSGDVKAREESRKFIVYGIIGLFVMTALWGIVNLLVNTFGVGPIGIPQISI